MTTYDIKPEAAGDSQIFRQNRGQDPARLLVPDANLFHKRPSLQSGDLVYLWPVGVEGLRQTGTATLAIHHYFGDDDADVQILHKDESRIEMSGTLPGVTGVDNMAALRLVIRDTTPDPGKILFLPGIFERLQYVVVENYDFNHAADDRTHSWDYVITFVRTGAGKRIRDPHGKPAPPNPTRRVTPKGKGSRYITVKANLRTFKQIAAKVYGTSAKWQHLVDLNVKLVKGIPNHLIPGHRWPLGTKIYY
jgi:hypothetical protein